MRLAANWSWLVCLGCSHSNGCLPAPRSSSAGFTHLVLFTSLFEVILSLCDLYFRCYETSSISSKIKKK